MIVYCLKYFTVKCVQFIFEIDRLMKMYPAIVLIYIKSIGVLIFPPLLLLAFLSIEISKPLAIFLLGGFFILILLRSIKGFIMARQNGVSTLYLFLYLCTLEILPWLVGGKILLGN